MLNHRYYQSGAKALLVIIGLFFVMALFGPELIAQEEGGDAEAAPTTMWTQIRQGGWAMIPLAIFSVGLIALAVYNFLQLGKKKFIPPELQETLMAHMSECRVRSAIEACAESPSYLGRMMATALPHVDATDAETLGRDDVDDAIAEFTVKENRGYMAAITWFSIISQAAPMVGLLGTVSGMIKAFATLGTSGGSDPSKLAANISEALITTASGLVVAIPALFVFFFFKNMLAKRVAECHTVAFEAMDASIAAVNAEQQFAKVPEGLHG